MKNTFLLCLALVLGGGMLACARGADLNGVELETLASFHGTNGSMPQGELVLGKDGSFYGVTSYSGASLGSKPGRVGCGTVFRVTTNGILTSLVSFNNKNGADPISALVRGNDGNLYGTSLDGGTNGAGTIFRITANGDFQTLHNFGGSDGWESPIRKERGLTHWQGTSSPGGGLVAARDGSFYGTSFYGGLDYGTIFRMTPDGQVTCIFLFDKTNGSMPSAGLAQDAEGNLYGTTQYDGANGREVYGYGTLFKVSPHGKPIWDISFAGTNGLHPAAGLIQGRGGNFYGTTYGGIYTTAYGPHGMPAKSAYCGGTIFRVTPGGALTTLVSFANTNGACPVGKLLVASDGNFYGAVRFCNAAGLGFSDETMGNGAIFKMTPEGKLRIVVAFNDPDCNTYPTGGLVEGPDGNLYGLASNGTGNQGAVFKLSLHKPKSNSTREPVAE